MSLERHAADSIPFGHSPRSVIGIGIVIVEVHRVAFFVGLHSSQLGIFTIQTIALDNEL